MTLSLALEGVVGRSSLLQGDEGQVIALDADRSFAWFRTTSPLGTVSGWLIDHSDPANILFNGPVTMVSTSEATPHYTAAAVPGTDIVLIGSYTDHTFSGGSARVTAVRWDPAAIPFSTPFLAEVNTVTAQSNAFYPPVLVPVSSSRFALFQRTSIGGAVAMWWGLYAVSSAGGVGALLFSDYLTYTVGPSSGGNVLWDAVHVNNGVILTRFADDSGGDAILPFRVNTDDTMVRGVMVGGLAGVWPNLGYVRGIRSDGHFTVGHGGGNSHFFIDFTSLGILFVAGLGGGADGPVLQSAWAGPDVTVSNAFMMPFYGPESSFSLSAMSQFGIAPRLCAVFGDSTFDRFAAPPTGFAQYLIQCSGGFSNAQIVQVYRIVSHLRAVDQFDFEGSAQLSLSPLAAPPLRQRQRDDNRNRQLSSRQKSNRQGPNNTYW